MKLVSYFLQLFASSFKQRLTSLITRNLIFKACCACLVNKLHICMHKRLLKLCGEKRLINLVICYQTQTTKYVTAKRELNFPLGPPPSITSSHGCFHLIRLSYIYAVTLWPFCSPTGPYSSSKHRFLLTRSWSSSTHNFTLPPTAGSVHPTWPSFLHQEKDSNLITLHFLPCNHFSSLYKDAPVDRITIPGIIFIYILIFYEKHRYTLKLFVHLD